MHNSKIEEKLSVLSHSPGVYLMKNADGKIIYVGKSKCLKNRVSSYFQSPDRLNIKTRKLVSNIDDFETIITNNETEAFILENELIKKHMPKYNIKLKDSKSYPYIKITNEKYPVLNIGHTRRNDGKYFGPYSSSAAAKDIVSMINKTFKLPTCKKTFVYGKKVCRPCLNYHISQCTAPCTGTIPESEYKDAFNEIEMILKGNYKDAEKSLEEKMFKASEEMRFEAAAKFRDSINNLKILSQKQEVKSSPSVQKDVFGFYESDLHAAAAILNIRNGAVIDKSIIHMNSYEITDTEELFDLILRYYDNPDTIPNEIYVSFNAGEEEINGAKSILSEKCGRSVNIRVPVKGVNKNLCLMADENAKAAIITKQKEEEDDSSLALHIAQTFNLEVVPERIESYDVSNSGESDMYCGMIVTENGKFKKSDYRLFSIKTVEGTDDYAAMREALKRRFSHLQSDTQGAFSVRPDLILLDGGIGHVSTIKSLEDEMEIDIPVLGMIKDSFHKTRAITDGENEISISKDRLLYPFIYKIQEEVHRYTFSKMDASRRKKMKTVMLTNVKGVGKARAEKLFEKFKTRNAIVNASVEELCEISGITPEIAKNIKEYLSNDTEDSK